MKRIIKISVVLAVATLISVMAVVTVSATSDINEKTNNGINSEYKEKKVTSYKVTWNANGGKIGSKKTKITSVKRSSKIGKLVTSPKRSKYSFKGWFTKKSGGKKVTKNTKITKKVTFFAQWKKTYTLNTAEKKLVGTWTTGQYQYYTGEKYEQYIFVSYKFNADGTYEGIISTRKLTNTPVTYSSNMRKGKWSATSTGIRIFNLDYFEGGDKAMKMWTYRFPTSDTSYGYELSSDGKTLYINNNIFGEGAFLNTVYKK